MYARCVLIACRDPIEGIVMPLLQPAAYGMGMRGTVLFTMCLLRSMQYMLSTEDKTKQQPHLSINLRPTTCGNKLEKLLP